ncbi:MAG: flagellar filament capping protein FliD [Spirochaetales bacterium]|nr:flagellar filament capping protein FliD [Spirochaetales bacterium]
MSDITIPGVNSGLNTDSIVSKLMEMEKIPLNRKKDDLESYENEKKIWQDLSKNLTNFEDTAKGLYGADNPFNERIVESSDEKVLTATADRGAISQDKELTVIKKASSDRFLSKSIDDKFEAPSGEYSFTIGDKNIDFNFRGGTVKRLVERINNRGNNLLRAQLIKDTPDTTVMLIESTKEGLDNKLVFNDGAAKDFAISAGILVQSDDSLREIPVKPSVDSKLTETTETGETLLNPGANGKIEISPAEKDTGNIYLELQVEIKNLESSEWTPPTQPQGPDKPENSGIDYNGIIVNNTDSLVSIPEWKKPEPPKTNVDFEVFSSDANGTKRFLPALKDTTEPQKLTVKLSDLGGSSSAINFENNNTNKAITIKKIKFYNPETRGGWEPSHPVDKASNSVVEVDGIKITRESNTIDDLIPGVTLTLKSESEDPVDLKITPDDELVKDRIIKFVGSYNRLQANLSILTSTDNAVISELDYFTDDEKEEAKDRLGYFQGDSTLIQVKSKLQNIFMSPYKTKSDESLKMLSQIGISTNSSGLGGGYNKSKLRGYIEINEDELDSSLANNMVAVKELFGYDSDGDLIVDTGAAYSAQASMKPYAGTNGIFSYRMSTLDSKIKRTERDISNYELKLADKEAELKNKYAKMEGSVNAMQQTSSSLQNLNSSGN